MSAEEFTDTVFAKIDINGDGEGTEEGLPWAMAVTPGEGQERRRREASCWPPPPPTSALAQN